MTSKQLFYLTGFQRSGTTLCCQLLDKHPDILCADEPEFAKRIIYNQHHLLNDLNNDSIKRNLIFYDVNKDKYLKVVDKFIHQDIDNAQFLRECYQLMNSKNASIYGAKEVIDIVSDKFKFIDSLLSIHKNNAKYIFIERGIAGVAASFIKLGFFPPAKRKINNSNLRKFVKDYNRILSHAKSIMPPNRTLFIRFEDLCGEPDETLREIFNFLDVSADTTLITKILTKPRNKIREKHQGIKPEVKDNWKNILTPDQLQLIHKETSMSTISKTKNIIKKRPTQAVIETTNHCNLNCPYCMVGKTREQGKDGMAEHSLMTRPMGYMNEPTFEKIVCELRKFGINKVFLHFQGEPFLNPLTAKFAEKLKNHGFFVGIFTNGQAFDDNNIAKIANADIDLIRFSVDGASEVTYQENRRGGTFAKVTENMRKVVTAHKGKHTKIEWQFLPMKNNEHEIETAEKMAKEIGIYFFTKGFRETDKNLAPDNPELRSSQLAKPCIDILKQLAVYWNGDVVPCCYDVDGFEIMGNIKNNSLSDIWNSEKYCAFRKNVKQSLRIPQNEPEICKECLRWQ